MLHFLRVLRVGVDGDLFLSAVDALIPRFSGIPVDRGDVLDGWMPPSFSEYLGGMLRFRETSPRVVRDLSPTRLGLLPRPSSPPLQPPLRT